MWNYSYQKDKVESGFNVLSAGIINEQCKEFKISLELGAGTGELSYLLLNKNPCMFIYLVDNSKSAINYIKEYYKDKNLKEGSYFNVNKIDIFQLNKEKPLFDLVMSSGLIEHYKDEELKKMVDYHKELSKKYIACIVPYANEENIKFSKSEFCINHYGYEKPLTEKELDELFIDKDFKKVHGELYYKNNKLLIGIYERIIK